MWDSCGDWLALLTVTDQSMLLVEFLWELFGFFDGSAGLLGGKAFLLLPWSSRDLGVLDFADDLGLMIA